MIMLLAKNKIEFIKFPLSLTHSLTENIYISAAYIFYLYIYIYVCECVCSHNNVAIFLLSLSLKNFIFLFEIYSLRINFNKSFRSLFPIIFL